jgi:phenylacetate-CoA ligase
MSIRQRLEFATTVHRSKTVPRWDACKVRALQDRRLRTLLRTARDRSPFYQQRLAGLDLDRVSLTDLPTVTKEELRDHWDDVVTDRTVKLAQTEEFLADDGNLGRWFKGEYALCHTSGSLGRPLVIVQDRMCLNVIFAMLASRCSVDGPPSLLEAVRRIVRPKKVAAISFRRGPYPSGMLLEFMQEILGRFVDVQRFSSVQPDLADRLAEYNPDSITGYASVLEALAMSAQPPRLPRLRQLTNSSEQLSPRAKDRIESVFSATILDHYGTGECLQLADGCPDCGHLHVNDDWAILESVDEQNRPVPAGVTGDKVLVTNLANHTQPFIRYEVGDRIAIAAEPCAARHLTRIQSIEGRSVEVFWVESKSGRRFLPGILFHSAIDAVGLVQDWQAIQRGPARIEVRLLPIRQHISDPSQLLGLVRESLVRNGFPAEIQLHVETVTQLTPNQRTGKMQRIVVEMDESASIASVAIG